jgi:hypothetical protein
MGAYIRKGKHIALQDRRDAAIRDQGCSMTKVPNREKVGE